MKRFYLRRKEDVSGVSGVGNVAEGVEFDNGEVAMVWLSGENSSLGFYKSVEKLINTHGHGGSTELIWIDGASSNVVVERSGCHCEGQMSVLSASLIDRFALQFEPADQDDVDWLRAPLTDLEHAAIIECDEEEGTPWEEV